MTCPISLCLAHAKNDVRELKRHRRWNCWSCFSCRLYMVQVSHQYRSAVKLTVCRLYFCDILLLFQTTLLNLPKTLLALAIWLLTSASMLAEQERTSDLGEMFFGLQFPILSCDVWFLVWIFWGRLINHFLFFVLMVKLKFLQADDNLSISCCISSSFVALSVQSLAKRISLITVSLTLVTAWRRFLSHLYLMRIPRVVCLKKSVSSWN